MQRVRQLARVMSRVSVQSAVGVAFIAAAVAVTLVANYQAPAATVDVVVAQHDVPTGVSLGTQRQVFGLVAVPTTFGLLDQLVTYDTFVASADAIVIHPVRAGDPLLQSMIGVARPSGTTLTLLLTRVAALDGDVVAGEQVRVLTSGGAQPAGIVVEIVGVRAVGGGLGRQEQVALTLRVPTVSQAARLFAAHERDALLLVRDAS